MSYKWPPKDPDEVLDYSIDWSRYLDTDQLNTVTWYCEDADGVKTLFLDAVVINGLQRISASNSTTVSTLQLGLGDNNTTYNIYCAITTVAGRSTERKVRLKVKQR
jgi:hypothetical protein